MRKSVNSSKVLKPRGSYSQVLKVGDFVYISGQMGIDLESGMRDTLETQVQAIFNNTKTLLSELNMHMNQITKSTVYITKEVDINVFDEFYEQNFKQPFPARSLVIVDELPEKDALVQIAFDAIDLRAYQIMNDCGDEGCDTCGRVDCEHSN